MYKQSTLRGSLRYSPKRCTTVAIRPYPKGFLARFHLGGRLQPFLLKIDNRLVGWKMMDGYVLVALRWSVVVV